MASFNDARMPVCTPWHSYHRNGFQAPQLQSRAVDCAFDLFVLGVLGLLQRFKTEHRRMRPVTVIVLDYIAQYLSLQ